ncbi:hypothetical protein ACQWHL_25565, partial [Salmonella enterica subsp. enterica serovar Infantis]
GGAQPQKFVTREKPPPQKNIKQNSHTNKKTKPFSEHQKKKKKNKNPKTQRTKKKKTNKQKKHPNHKKTKNTI